MKEVIAYEMVFHGTDLDKADIICVPFQLIDLYKNVGFVINKKERVR